MSNHLEKVKLLEVGLVAGLIPTSRRMCLFTITIGLELGSLIRRMLSYFSGVQEYVLLTRVLDVYILTTSRYTSRYYRVRLKMGNPVNLVESLKSNSLEVLFTPEIQDILENNEGIDDPRLFTKDGFGKEGRPYAVAFKSGSSTSNGRSLPSFPKPNRSHKFHLNLSH